MANSNPGLSVSTGYYEDDPAMRNSRYSTLLRILLILIAAAGIVFWCADTRDRFELGMHLDSHARDPFEMDYDTRQITSVQPEAEHAGLVKGSTVESLNGAPYTGRAQLAEVIRPAGPGESVAVDFRRPDGSSGSAVITLVAHAPLPGGNVGFFQVFWQSFLLFNFLPLLCMLIGYWVVFAKPDEPNAWLLLVLLLYPEVVFALGTGWATGGWLFFRGLYFELLQNFGYFALVPFAVYFPERSRIDIKLPWLKWVVLGPGLICGILEIRQLFAQYYFGGDSPRFAKLMTQVDRVDNSLALACVIFYLVIMTDKLLSASTEDARRRLRVVLAGTGIGIGALIVAFVLLPDIGLSPQSRRYLWVAYVGATLFLLAPLSLAYVVLVQRAMDVSILIRQGTRYTAAKTTIWVVQIILLAFASYYLLLPLITQKQVPRDQLVEAVLFILLFAILRFVFSKSSQNWLDKKFFREAYDSERVLSELSDEVRKYTDSAPLLQTVAKCIAETLHVTQIGMMLRDGPKFCMAQAVGHFPGDSNSMALAANSSTIRNLTNTNAPARLYREDPDAWYLMADEMERQTLDDLGTELLLPLPGRNRLMGVMALGPKRSEAAYSKSDLHLLQVLATQTGMALEVSELAHSLAKEAAQRERANREMEIAREVQERLFPQEMPTLLGGSIAGHCRPALGVGGDYYDVFPLQDGRLGLAIGDVSGKGISAALLMASLRASLRGVTLDNPRDFAKLMDKVNRLVYEASASNRYATFFFSAFNPVTRVLECVNAGHNAPLVLRHNPGGSTEILRLEADGPVVGLLPFAPYSEQSLQLQPGDLLITYTDGISEAMTHDDEEWGEERMMAAAASAKDAPARVVLDTIFAEADKFTAGAPQHDDMTMLILKLDSLPADQKS
jgi:sigma-B regulation protein RsbU (phosphoserine phosphatase)